MFDDDDESNIEDLSLMEKAELIEHNLLQGIADDKINDYGIYINHDDNRVEIEVYINNRPYVNVNRKVKLTIIEKIKEKFKKFKKWIKND